MVDLCGKWIRQVALKETQPNIYVIKSQPRCQM